MAFIRFAHRGAPARRGEGNTLNAFAAALAAGAEGIESDIRMTADGVPVLLHGLGRFGRRPVGQLTRSELPAHVPALCDLWERCGADFELSLDMSDPRAAKAVIELAHRYSAESRLWLTYWRLPLMAAWRRRWPQVHLVYATMLALPGPMLRRTVANVSSAGVDAVNLHHRLLTSHTAETVHGADLKLFAWGLKGAQHVHRVRALGADAVFVDEVVAANRVR